MVSTTIVVWPLPFTFFGLLVPCDQGHTRLWWVQYVHICFNYPLAYLKYLGKYALTADVSAYVK